MHKTHFVIDKIEGAIQSLGDNLEQVVRNRIFIRHINDWEAIARAHGERFKTIQPVNTMVKAELIGDEYLIRNGSRSRSLIKKPMVWV
ncbi:MAG: Rid family hydrolase [Cytophagales bacterium]|nr:Rid family hydrolase [Cytophagales bacterium]